MLTVPRCGVTADLPHAQTLTTASPPINCAQVIKKLAGRNWPSAKIEFDCFRASQAIFPSEVWDAADKYHAYQWWASTVDASFGDDFKYF